MTALLVAGCSLLGLLIGSFLNVVIARVPAGASVVSPGSACPRCGTPIGPRDNVPVLSWLLLRGRSRCCDEPISARYPVVEALTAVAFGAVALWTLTRDGPDDPVPAGLLPALLFLAAISIALTAIDLEHFRLPDAITFPSYPVALVLLAVPALLSGESERLVRAVICGVALFAFYALLWIVYPAGMGLGDVKLAGILGMYLGWFGYGQAVVGGFAAFLLGGVVGIGLIALRRADRKTNIPFGPYMIVGAWLSIVVGGWIAHWYLRSIGL